MKSLTCSCCVSGSQTMLCLIFEDHLSYSWIALGHLENRHTHWESQGNFVNPLASLFILRWSKAKNIYIYVYFIFIICIFFFFLQSYIHAASYKSRINKCLKRLYLSSQVTVVSGKILVIHVRQLSQKKPTRSSEPQRSFIHLCLFCLSCGTLSSESGLCPGATALLPAWLFTLRPMPRPIRGEQTREVCGQEKKSLWWVLSKKHTRPTFMDREIQKSEKSHI